MRNQLEANLQALIESTEDPIWSVGLDYRLITFNRALQQNIAINYGNQVAVGKGPADFLPPDKAACWPVFYDRALSEGPFRTEYSLVDGRTLELSFNPILVDGKAAGVSVFGKDITEQKLAHDSLRESQEQLRLFFEHSPAALAMFDNQMNYLYASRRWMADFNLGDRDLRGLSYHDVFPDVPEKWREAHRRALAGEVLKEEADLFERADGSAMWVQWELRPWHHADGTVGGVVIFTDNVTERKRAADALRDSEARYRAVFQTGPDAININRLSDGALIDCNQSFVEMSGYTHKEAVGHTTAELGIWTRSVDRKCLLDVLECDGFCQNLEFWLKRKNEEAFIGSISSSVVEIDGVPCILSFTRDVTDVKVAEQRLAAALRAQLASETRYRIAFQTSLDAIAITRQSDGKYIEVNQALLDMLEYEREEVMGRSALALNIWADPAEQMELERILARDGECRGLEIRFMKKNGAVLWGQLSATPIEIDGVPCILSVVRDITDAKAAVEEIKSLAFFDPLTQLPNRRLLMDRMRQALAASLRSGRYGAMLFIDLDDFKMLNDTLGHTTGDMLLQEVARRLRGATREADTVARLGGDEFVVILENLSGTAEAAAGEAGAIAEDILAVVQQPCLLAGHQCTNTCSMGITLFGDQLDSVDDILQHADIAMYQAKAAGRKTIRFFAPALQAAVNTRARMEYDLSQAVEQNQFQLYYQPQVDRGSLIGVEALVRWNHPERGLVWPDEFIPLAEETGQIIALGTWVLETACKQIAAWQNRAETAHIVVAVNISAREFRQPDFAEKVMNVLDLTGADPRRLRLELTESMLLKNIEDVNQKIFQLRSAGLSLALDDFGTGYSSLAYLKSVPLDQLKIDHVFVRDMLADASSGAIVQTIISLSKAMGLSVTAEGVETEEQRAVLTRLGCHSFQGYLFGPAVPLEAFESGLRASPGKTVSVAFSEMV